MVDFEHPNDNLNLGLSRETLLSVRKGLAEALILHGTVSEGKPDKILPSGQVPHDFEYSFDKDAKEAIAELVFPEEGVVVVSAKATEMMPYDDVPSDPDPNLGKYSHSVFLAVDGVIQNDLMNTVDRLEVRVIYSISERYYSDDIKARRSVEYSQGGKWISPNGKSYKVGEDHIGLINDRESLDRNLTLEDAEVLAKVADYINAG